MLLSDQHAEASGCEVVTVIPSLSNCWEKDIMAAFEFLTTDLNVYLVQKKQNLNFLFRRVSLQNLSFRTFLHCSLRMTARRAIASNHYYCMDILDFDTCCYNAAQVFESMFGYNLCLCKCVCTCFPSVFLVVFFAICFLGCGIFDLIFVENQSLNEAS